MAIQPQTAGGGGGGGGGSASYELVVRQWVRLQDAPSTGAIAFGGADGSLLFVGAAGKDTAAVYGVADGAFVAVA